MLGNQQGKEMLGELNNSKTTYCYSRKGQAIGVRRRCFHDLVEQMSLLYEAMSHTCTSFLRYLAMVENPKKQKKVAKRTMNKKLRHTPIKFMTSFQFLLICN